jgi:hypothetical protein
MDWHAARAERSTVSVSRSPRASRLVGFHRWSRAFNSGVALGSTRTSMPTSSAPPRLSGEVGWLARSSKSTIFPLRQWDRIIARMPWSISWVHSMVIRSETSPVLTLIAPSKDALGAVPRERHPDRIAEMAVAGVERWGLGDDRLVAHQHHGTDTAFQAAFQPPFDCRHVWGRGRFHRMPRRAIATLTSRASDVATGPGHLAAVRCEPPSRSCSGRA